MNVMGLEETLDGLVRTSRGRWYGHILKRNSYDELRKALDFELVGRRERGRPKLTLTERNDAMGNTNFLET